jgi:CheY-like chemotaxis protein
MSKKLLIVEDDRNINIMIQLILKNKKLDWEFRSARDGVEALQILASYKADLALIDLELPKLNGVELIHKIQGDQTLSPCKLAVLTSTSNEAAKTAVRAARVPLWMKPITAEGLFTNIAALLG